MTNETETFARPDLFERDTWNRQVHDLRRVASAVRDGTLVGGNRPQVWFGHSRGGVTVLLAAGRGADDDARGVRPAGVVTAAAPARCCSLTDEQQAELLERGYLESPSSRTGQALRVGRDFLDEILDYPEAHDVPALAGRITAPVLTIHGAEDPTVPAEDARIIGAALRHGRVVIIDGGDHVFNTPNPMPPGQPPSPQLRRLLEETTAFARRCCGA